MRIFVISLSDATQRRRNVNDEFKPHKLEFEFFDAVGDISKAFSLIDGIDRRTYRLNTRRDALPSEICCYASHFSLWQKCIELDEPILVMEDDLKLHSNFSAAVRKASALIADYGFIRLESLQRRQRPYQLKKSGAAHVLKYWDDFQLSYLADPPLCMLAYALSPEAARQLVERSHVIVAPVDKFIQHTRFHQVPIFGLSPTAVSLAECATVSTIGDRSHKSRNPFLLLHRLIYKSVNEVQRHRFNRKQLAGLRGGQRYPADATPPVDTAAITDGSLHKH